MERTIPIIANCNATKCVYNYSGQCRTLAVNIGGPEPMCDTYWTNGKKGGFENLAAKIGACKVANCMHNKSFECTAPSVEILCINDMAECTTFQERL